MSQIARPRAGRTLGLILIVAWAVAPILAARAAHPREGQARNRTNVMSTVPITPVEGPSTLHHLGLTIEESSMGWAGQWSATVSTPLSAAEANMRSEPAGGPFVLTGADLYRISCRA